jgi:hypothetical protein
MTTTEQAAALRQYEAGGTVAESDLPALTAGARALDLLAMAEGAEAFRDVRISRPGGRDDLYPGQWLASVEDAIVLAPTEAGARRALAARLLATALRLVEGT